MQQELQDVPMGERGVAMDLHTLTPTRLKHETHTKAQALSYTQI
jgi:hypothetical protein